MMMMFGAKSDVHWTWRRMKEKKEVCNCNNRTSVRKNIKIFVVVWLTLTKAHVN